MLRLEKISVIPIENWPSNWRDEDIKNQIEALSRDELKKLLNQRTRLGNTCLHLAVEKGLPLTVSALLQGGVDVNAAGDEGKTALHIAALAKNDQMVNLLLAAGAQCQVRDDDNNMPIHLAAMAGSAEIVDVLVKHDINQLTAKGNSGRTAFIQAVFNNRQNVLEVLIGHGDDINQIHPNSGHSAMHIAAIKNKGSLIVFLSRYGADVECLSSADRTPLQYCAVQKNPSLDAAKELVANGADVNAGNPSPMELLLDYTNLETPRAVEFAALLAENGARAKSVISNASKPGDV